MSVTDAGRVLGGITSREVYKRLAAGDLESVKIGRRRLVVAASVDAYIDRLRKEGSHHMTATAETHPPGAPPGDPKPPDPGPPTGPGRPRTSSHR